MCKLALCSELGFMTVIVALRIKVEVSLVCQTDSSLYHHYLQVFNTRITHQSLTSSNVDVNARPMDDF